MQPFQQVITVTGCHGSLGHGFAPLLPFGLRYSTLSYAQSPQTGLGKQLEEYRNILDEMLDEYIFTKLAKVKNVIKSNTIK